MSCGVNGQTNASTISEKDERGLLGTCTQCPQSNHKYLTAECSFSRGALPRLSLLSGQTSVPGRQYLLTSAWTPHDSRPSLESLLSMPFWLL